MKSKSTPNGFSLVELGIVILVIGLIAGGVLTAYSMLRSAEIQSVIADMQRYEAATAKFVATYASIPGDMVDATDNWAVAANGDGDGYIDNADATPGAPSEPFQFWRQLQLADALDIAVTGTNGPAATVDLQPGQNIPAGKITGSGWYVGFDASAVLGTGRMFDIAPPGNFMLFAGATTSATIGASILTPTEAYNIDRKIDDGIPGQGDVIGFGWNNTCSTPTSGGAASNNYATQYQSTVETQQCALVFLNRF
jgi:type II secretory pathway pseudopilin PulG